MFDPPSFDAVLTARPQGFVNMHKLCDYPDETQRAPNSSALHQQACEAFRFAQILEAGGMIFSERCEPADEAEYAGLVRFSPLAEIGSRALAWWGEGGGHARDTLERAERFAERFAPSAIFRRAGLEQLQHRVRHACTG